MLRFDYEGTVKPVVSEAEDTAIVMAIALG